MNKNSKRTAEILRSNAAVRGIMRTEHFASGGTTAMWRGTHTVTKNGKGHASKNACRGQVRDW